MSSRKKVVVTGGAGFIGSHLSNYLSDEFEVYAIDNLSTGDWSRLNHKVNRLELDITNVNLISLVEIFTEAEFVCHLAAVKLHNEENSIEQIEKVNLLATQKIAIACGLAGVNNLLFTSSLYAYGNKGPNISSETDQLRPYNDYGRSKAMGEEIVKRASQEFGFRALIPRLFFIYGPQQFAPGGYKSVIVKSLEKITKGEPLELVGDGLQEMDFVFIDDCIEALVSLMKSQTSGAFNISSGIGLRVRDILSVIQRDTNMRFIQLPADWTAGTKRLGSCSKISSELGWSARTGIEEGIEATRRSLQ